MDHHGEIECLTCKKAAIPDAEPSGFFCTACARAMFYPAKIRLAQVLVEKEELKKAVDALSDPNASTDGIDADTLQLARAWRQMWKDAEDEARREQEREELRERIKETAEDLERRKEHARRLRERNERREAELEAAREKDLEPMRATIAASQDAAAKVQVNHAKLNAKAIETKATLCREAASLLKLRHHKRKAKDGSVKDCYSIAGLWLPDLRDINNMRCIELTAALATTSHLLLLVAFYLSIRLPAEVIPPHRDFPLPCINPPDKSYLLEHKHIPFPGSGTSLSIPSTPTTSRGGLDPSSVPRPRPLFCSSDDHSETVSQFSKREPAAFNFFTEAIALLAFDIAYLSRTQGFVAGTESWEDIVDVGRMLYTAILAPGSYPSIARITSTRDDRHRSHSQDASSPSPSPAPSARLGSASHNSAQGFLGSAATIDPMKGWKLNTYTVIRDPLRKHLLTEMNNAEWEVLDEAEWDDGGEKMDDAVVVGAKAEDKGERKKEGKSGWTKVKPREKQ